MEIPTIMDIGNYQFKNYRILTDKEQKIDSIELSFVCKKENLDRILETIINEHHYEQPNIQVQDVLTTRTSYDVNNKNPNRFWNKK